MNFYFISVVLVKQYNNQLHYINGAQGENHVHNPEYWIYYIVIYYLFPDGTNSMKLTPDQLHYNVLAPSGLQIVIIKGEDILSEFIRRIKSVFVLKHYWR